MLSVNTLPGWGQEEFPCRVAGQPDGLPKARGAFCGSGLAIILSVCIFSIWSKTSKSLQSTEIDHRSERVSLFYVRLLFLYLLVQISINLASHLIFSFKMSD